jgi:hypothetical protein
MVAYPIGILNVDAKSNRERKSLFEIVARQDQVIQASRCGAVETGTQVRGPFGARLAQALYPFCGCFA